ncbi:hypothetical protein AN237_25225 (plasmid) [Raoultella ornithinolytica]|uniref:hypothetical protein n=1 Tax=Raoultella ornithinolytica TaxID=54291 RepID=UPI00084A0632|nr:hypothetical protein [Raoultella ornithinolytica]AOO59859.1 hypothetical protein AN237_25225 [Raoultella ornithinolytica]
MKKTILSILLCLPFSPGMAAENNENTTTPEEQYIDAVRAILPEMGIMISDISNVRKLNCNKTISVKGMQDTLANDEFIFDTLKKNASDSSYLGSDAYRTALNDTYKHCK